MLEPPAADRLLPSQGTFGDPGIEAEAHPVRRGSLALADANAGCPPSADALRTGVRASDIAERRPSSAASRGRGWRDPATLPLPLLVPLWSSRGGTLHPPTVGVPSCVPTALYPSFLGAGIHALPYLDLRRGPAGPASAAFCAW